MCFICKLSFGNTKSFGLHANTEHSLNIQECEKILLSREYSSAIIQRNVDEKPQISFLEPLDMHKQQQPNKVIDDSSANTRIQMDSSASATTTTAQSNAKNNNINNNNNIKSETLSSGKSAQNTDGSPNTTQTSQSPQPSATANSNRAANTPTPENCSSNLSATAANNNNKLLNDFLLQQQQSLGLHRGDRSTPSLLATLQQQQQLLLQQPLGCPDHPTVKGLDCKTCEMLECSFFGLNAGSAGSVGSGLKSPITPIKSPNSVSNLANSTSPPGSASLTMSPTSQPAPSFTIGACPEHVNGRPFGVECARYVPFVHLRF